MTICDNSTATSTSTADIAAFVEVGTVLSSSRKIVLVVVLASIIATVSRPLEKRNIYLPAFDAPVEVTLLEFRG